MTSDTWDDTAAWSGTDDIDMDAPDDYPDPPDGAHPDGSRDRSADDDPQLYYPTLDAFVRDLLAPTYRRHIDGRNRSWCPQWWRHAEAIARLEALWRSWEHLRLDPATGTSVWLRDHADHHMNVLLDADAGPFKYCTPDRGHTSRLDPLPLVEPPQGLFT